MNKHFASRGSFTYENGNKLGQVSFFRVAATGCLRFILIDPRPTNSWKFLPYLYAADKVCCIFRCASPKLQLHSPTDSSLRKEADFTLCQLLDARVTALKSQ